METEKTLTITEAAEILGCSRHTIYAYIKKGIIVPVPCVLKRQIKLSDIEKLKNN